MTNKLRQRRAPVTAPIRRWCALLVAACGALLAFGVGATAHAKNITRSCEGRLIATHRATGATATLDEFSAKGGCGSAVPNRCRERARDTAHSCVQKHWSTRFDRQKPPECSGGVSGYDLQDLKGAIESAACRLGWVNGASAFVSLEATTSGDKNCGRKATLITDYEVKPSMCGSLPNVPAPVATGGGALLFPPSDTLEPVSGLKFPSSMPKVRFPEGFKGCSEDEKGQIRRAWALAHYMLWTANRVMGWLNDNPKHRASAWAHGFQNPTTANNFANYAPRGWFGAYSDDNFHTARHALDKLWDNRMTGHTFTVKCRSNDDGKGAHPCYRNSPATGRPPSANHIVYGTINFCLRAFDKNDNDTARLVIHELLHWMTNNKGQAIQDRHTHCHGSGKCTTNKGYGVDDSSHLANYDGGSSGTANAKQRRREAHRERALRNNDNYAWFVNHIGRVSRGETVQNLPPLTQFPAPGFVF